VVEQSKREEELLTRKETEIEKLKRQVGKMQKDSKGKGGSTTPIQKRGSFNSTARPKIVRKQTMQEEWLPSELDYQVKNFNNLFIQNLSESLSKIIVKKPENQEEQKEHPPAVPEEADEDMHESEDESEGEEAEKTVVEEEELKKEDEKMKQHLED